MPDEPDPAHFARFCTEILPGMLEVCEVPAPDAALVAQDVSLRAEAVARMELARREILAAPFYEESFTHEPNVPELRRGEDRLPFARRTCPRTS